MDNSVEQDPRHRVHPAGCPRRWRRARLAREVDRGVLMDERQRHELREPARFELDPSETTDVENPVRRRVHVTVHDRRGGADAQVVGGFHDLLPRVGGELALRQQPAHVVVEDLRGGARDRAQPARTALGEELAERDAELRAAVQDLHGAERVDVDIRYAGLHRVEEIEVEGAREVGMDAALHAHLGRAPAPRLLGPVGHLGKRQRVGLGIDLALRERAEAASDVAHVREVDVAVHDVGDVVADRLGAQVVGDPAERLERRALGAEQRERLLVGDRPMGGGLRERDLDVGIEAFGVTSLIGPSAGHVVLEQLEVAVHGGGILAEPGGRALREREGDLPRLPDDVGVLPGDRVRERVRRRQAVLADQRCDRRAHLAGEVGIGPERELRIDGEPLAELEAALGGAGREGLDLRATAARGSRGRA